jgi:RNA polymerase sigma-70 factor (ECF subfamily)
MPTTATRATVAAGREPTKNAVTSRVRYDRSGLDADVRRAQGGDLGAYEAIYRAHVGRVHALCLRMTGDAARAAELTQDVFVRAWERLGRFRGGAVLATWLHRMTVNLVLEQARAEARRAWRVRAAGGDGEAAAVAEGERSGGALPSGERIDFERAVAALPPGARTAFVLHDVEGYTHAEIARLTGGAEETIRAQLHRARRRLMESLSR